MDLPKTLLRYMKPGVTWFVLDFLSTFPYSQVSGTLMRCLWTGWSNRSQ